VGYEDRKEAETVIDTLEKAGYTITVDWKGKKRSSVELKLL